MSKITRRESRETALAILFEWSFKDETLDEIIQAAMSAREMQADEFAFSLAEKVVQNREELDTLIEQYSQGWKLSRISRIALTVLRMSFCELTKFGDIPVGASINEAVELVKKYGTDEEAAYLNGILGSFDKVRRGLMEAPAITTVSTEDIHDTTEQTDNTVQIDESEPAKTEGEVELLDDIIIEVD